MNSKTTQHIVEQVRSAPTFAEAIERLARAAQALTDCEAVMLRFTMEDSSARGWAPAVFEVGFGDRFLRDETLIDKHECLCGRICRGQIDTDFPFFTGGGSFLWGDVQTVARDYPVEALEDVRGRCIHEGFESVAIVPLLSEEGSPLGCLHLADFAHGKFAGHLDVLEELGRLSGPILARFPAEQIEASVVKAVEEALMPTELEKTAGLDVAVSFTSATEAARLGGDFYDVIGAADGGTILVVGDYAGKGIGAAGMAARARYAIATATTAYGGQDLDGILATAETALLESFPSGGFVTVVVCRYSPDGTLEAAVAGHPAPLLLQPGGEAEELDLPPNRPVGHFWDICFRSRSTGLPPDHTILLYTDGIVESRRDGRFFGVEGIARLWRSDPEAELGDFAARLCSASAEFHEDGRPEDDRLVLAARPCRD